ncbi:MULTISPECIES: DNA cytosine methyltransferase [unclassified Streptomyces]|uniref:DNA cytosine methyltransferase n=1 Tax=unclassified Streptomyces TaxID=2593676 RepID=UPI000A72AE68
MISFLYPRLLAGQATPIYADYYRLSIRELTDLTAFTHESAVYVATGGDRVSVERLRELRAGVVDLATRAGFPDDSDRARNAEFDLDLAAFLHGEMGMVPAEAAARDVWAFLALVVLPDVSFWRYPRPPKDRVLGTDLTRHVFGRLWWRAQLVHSHEAPEPYGALKILGEAAFDQIYARRAALGGSPHMVRSILRVWNDLDLQGLNERETLRDFLKRLLRLAPFVLFDGVGEAALDDELRAVAEESLVAQQRLVDLARAEKQSVPAPRRTPPAEFDDRTVPDSPESASEPVPMETARIVEPRLRSIEVCAGCGAQALGLEKAGFDPVLLIDSKQDACSTIRANRPHWDVACMDIAEFRVFRRQDVIGVDLLSGGLPRVKSSATGGRDEDTDERKVLRTTVDLARVIRPKAVLLENVPDLVESPNFEADRLWITETLATAGYECNWAVLNAADFGVPQNRRSGFLVALQEPYRSRFSWPRPIEGQAPTVGQVLRPSMSARGWPGAESWTRRALRVAPALVGGSDRRGGADLGPTGSKKAWEALGVDGISLGNEPPGPDFPVEGLPKLTVEQAALIQSIPEEWEFHGGKTSRYRQIGHAMPPPLATAVGQAVATALRG